MAAPAGQKFRFRKDSPFSAEVSKFNVLEYIDLKYTATLMTAFGTKFYDKSYKKVFKYREAGELKYTVRRTFGTKFYPKYDKKVLSQEAFQQVIDRFLDTVSVRPTIPAGYTPTSEETVQCSLSADQKILPDKLQSLHQGGGGRTGYKPVVINLVGGTELHKFHTCIRRTLRSWKNKICIVNFIYSRYNLFYLFS